MYLNEQDKKARAHGSVSANVSDGNNPISAQQRSSPLKPTAPAHNSELAERRLSELKAIAEQQMSELEKRMMEETAVKLDSRAKELQESADMRIKLLEAKISAEYDQKVKILDQRSKEIKDDTEKQLRGLEEKLIASREASLLHRSEELKRDMALQIRRLEEQIARETEEKLKQKSLELRDQAEKQIKILEANANKELTARCQQRSKELQDYADGQVKLLEARLAIETEARISACRVSVEAQIEARKDGLSQFPPPNGQLVSTQPQSHDKLGSAQCGAPEADVSTPRRKGCDRRLPVIVCIDFVGHRLRAAGFDPPASAERRAWSGVGTGLALAAATVAAGALLRPAAARLLWSGAGAALAAAAEGTRDAGARASLARLRALLASPALLARLAGPTLGAVAAGSGPPPWRRVLL
jgi:hypothetical protein